jgi:hypothetical protein
MIFGNPKVTFTTYPELYGVIPEPIPARSLLPDWFKKLKGFANQDPDSGTVWPNRTIKRCPPVLDAMVSGWILTTPAEMEVSINDDGSGVEWHTDFTHSVIEEHATQQIKGHPSLPRLPLKIMNYWHMRTPPGWSTLFVSPLNRENKYFEPMAGVVETDKYLEFVNFPSFLKPKGTTLLIPRGYPVVQAIPFKRGMDRKSDIRAMSSKEVKALNHLRSQRTSRPSLYRETMWERK